MTTLLDEAGDAILDEAGVAFLDEMDGAPPVARVFAGAIHSQAGLGLLAESGEFLALEDNGVRAVGFIAFEDGDTIGTELGLALALESPGVASGGILMLEDGGRLLAEDDRYLALEDAAPTLVLVAPNLDDARGGGRRRAEKIIAGRWPGVRRYAAVLKIDGSYVTVEDPSTDQLDAATEVYMGGHVNEVDATTGAALVLAGYALSETFD